MSAARFCVFLGLAMQSGATIGCVKVGDAEQAAVPDPPAANCRLSATTDRKSYGFDQPVRLHLTIENVGSEPARLIGSPFSILTQRGFRLDVRLPDGTPVPMTHEGERIATAPWSGSATTLEPGKSATATIPMVNRLYDMTLPGEYMATAYWQVASGKSGEGPNELESTVRIVICEMSEEQE